MKESVKAFDGRGIPVSELPGPALNSLLAAASDVSLILDESGVIREVSPGQADPVEESRGWVGSAWVEIVAPESRSAVQDILREAGIDGVSRRRLVNHLAAHGPDIPIAYTAVRLKDDRQFVALGRDLSPVSALQRQLVEAQQSLEREYWRMRHFETRYRLLFQVSSEPVLVVDAVTQRVVEVNPAAAVLFDTSARKLLGRQFPFDVDRASEGAVLDLLAAVRAHGQGDDLTVPLGLSARPCTLKISLVRQDTQSLFVVRVLPENRQEDGSGGTQAARSARLVQAIPDGFVVADDDGRVVSANRAFLDLVEVATEAQVRHQPLNRWIGRPGADLGLILATLREHGLVRLLGTSLRGELGSTAEVEVSGAMIPEGSTPLAGLLIRDVGRRIATGPSGARDLTQAVEQLTALVGRVSLKNLVRDTADLLERHFIEAALEMTKDNRTSAAAVLGVSRQSLYVKLRRYNVGAAENGEAPKPKPKARRKKH